MKKYDITMLYLVLDCLNVLCTFWNVIEFFFLAIMQLWLSNRIRKTVLIPFISFTGKSLIIIKKLSFITRWVPLHSFKKVLWIDTKRIVNDHRLHVFTLVYIYDLPLLVYREGLFWCVIIYFFFSNWQPLDLICHILDCYLTLLVTLYTIATSRAFLAGLEKHLECVYITVC